MIKDKSRAGWFGASDTATIMGNWETDTFARWWNIKLGLTEGNFSNQYTAAGTAYEHRILDHLGIKGRDRQIRMKKWNGHPIRLRVNLDGEDNIIHEVKTHKSEKFTVTKAYWMQAQVEMFATGKLLCIDSYRLLPEDYDNFFNPIDPTRLRRQMIQYDPTWVQKEYMPRLIYLTKCMKEGRFPCKAEFATLMSAYSTPSRG